MDRAFIPFGQLAFLVENGADFPGGLIRRADQLYSRPHYFAYRLYQERIMCTAENHSIDGLVFDAVQRFCHCDMAFL
ncbi:hypothetical protein D3C81_2256490 [compost metagenome]